MAMLWICCAGVSLEKIRHGPIGPYKQNCMGHFNDDWVNIVLAADLFYITNAADHVCQENNLCCTYKIGMTLKQ